MLRRMNGLAARCAVGMFVIATLVVAGAALAAVPTEWDITLQPTLNGSAQLACKAGLKTGATDNYDVGVDALAPPASPDGDITYFSSITGQGSPYDKLSEDYRATGYTARTFRLAAKVADTKTLVISWTSANFPQGWVFTYQEANASWVGTGTVTSMSTTSNITIANATGDLLTKRYLVVATPQTYSISGTVTLTGGTSSVTAVTLNLSGDAVATTSPAANGAYSFTNLPAGGNYTVTPTLANYTFSPASQNFNPLNANQTQNFTGTYNLAVVSGTISYSGALTGTIHIGLFTTPDFTGEPAFSADIAAPGAYTISAVTPGTYYAAAYRGDTDFDPAVHPFGTYASNPFALVAAQTKTSVNITLVNPSTYTISGTVSITGASSVTQVLLTLTGKEGHTTNPAANGTYSFTNLPAGNYTLTPTLADYTFNPVNRTYSPLGANQTNQNFTAIPPNFTLTVVSAHDTPNPSVGDHDYPQSTSVTASVTTPADTASGTRYRCTGWTGTGNVPATGTAATTTFTILQDSSITWNWLTQYQLTTAVAPVGGGTVTPAPAATGGWYDTGTVVTMTQQAATNYLFKWWQISDGTTTETDASASIQVTMDKAKTVTGVFIYNLAQLQVEPTSASFLFTDSEERKDGTTQETDIVISNIGSGEVALSWQVGTITYVPAGSSGWAALAPTSGDLAAGETELAVLTVDRGVLPVGTYTATIPITSNGGTQNITVTMTIANRPAAAIIYPNDEDVAVETFLTFQAEFTSDSPIARSHWAIYEQNNVTKGTSGGSLPGYTLIYQTDITGPETSITAPWALFSPAVPAKGSGIYAWTVQCWESLADLPSEVAASNNFTVVMDQTYADQRITGQGLVDIQAAFAAVNADVQAALHDVVEGETVVAAVSGGPTVFIRSLNPEDVDGTNKPEGLDFFFDVRVEGVTAGETAVVAIYLPGNHMGEEWYKYNSLLDVWYTYAGAVFNRTVTVGGETYTEVLLTLVDGGAGDFDGAANGTIADPSGSVTIPAGGEVRGGGCFIATAAFGSYQEYHVWILRQFRDNFLLTNTAGRAFVRWYYRHSPKYAAVIADNDGLRAVVRCVLLPVYGIAWLTLKLGAAFWLLLAALGLAFALRRRMPAAAKLAVIAGIMLAATPSFAVDFNHFKVAPGEQQFLVNSSAQSLPKGHLLTDVFYTYADKPGIVKVAGVDRDISKSQNIVMLSTAYAFTDKFQMSLFIPVLASQSSDAFFTGVKSGGLGNVTLAGKYSFCGGKDKIGCAVVPYVALPTGDADNLISPDSTAGGLKVVVDKNWDDRTFVTLNVGYYGQNKEEIGQITVESGFTYGTGISRILPNNRTSLTAEIYGRVDKGSKSSPIEGILALGHQFKCAQFVIGGGAGLNDGYGAPEFRGFVGVKLDWPLLAAR